LDTREYIASGTLDSYVAGILSVEEMHDVELMACQEPEIKTELQSLQSLVDSYAMQYAMAPPAGVKQNIMRAIEGEKESEVKRPVVREMSSSRSSFAKYLAAASVALLIVAGGMAYRYANKASDNEQQVARLSAQQSFMQNELNSLHESLNSKESQLAILEDPSVVRVAMRGTPKSPQSAEGGSGRPLPSTPALRCKTAPRSASRCSTQERECVSLRFRAERTAHRNDG